MPKKKNNSLKIADVETPATERFSPSAIEMNQLFWKGIIGFINYF